MSTSYKYNTNKELSQCRSSSSRTACIYWLSHLLQGGGHEISNYRLCRPSSTKTAASLPPSSKPYDARKAFRLASGGMKAFICGTR